jgi:hypothetical protein
MFQNYATVVCACGHGSPWVTACFKTMLLLLLRGSLPPTGAECMPPTSVAAALCACEYVKAEQARVVPRHGCELLFP